METLPLGFGCAARWCEQIREGIGGPETLPIKTPACQKEPRAWRSDLDDCEREADFMMCVKDRPRVRF